LHIPLASLPAHSLAFGYCGMDPDALSTPRPRPPGQAEVMLNLTVLSDEGDLVHVECVGEISQVRFQGDENAFVQLLGPQVWSRQVLLHLERVEFLDSSGISWFVVSHKHFQQHGGALVLHSVPPRILQVLQFCRMDKLLRIAGDEAEARSLLPGVKP
jgi:anti-anti-sigma factor